MNTLVALWTRVREADGNLSTHLSDLLILLGYLAVGIYAGGYQYVVSYNNFFALPVKPDAASLSTFVTFVENVVLGSGFLMALVWMGLLSLIVFFNFVIRIAFRVWFSYVTISLVAIVSIVSFVALGALYGVTHAQNDISADSKLPSIELHTMGDTCTGITTNRRNLRLLFRDAGFIYFFQPVDAKGSEVIIRSISVKCVAGVTLTSKRKL